MRLSGTYIVQLIDNPLSATLPPVAVCQCAHAPVNGCGTGADEAQRVVSAYGEAIERDAIWTGKEDFVARYQDGFILPRGIDVRPPRAQELEWAYFYAADGERHSVHRPCRGSTRPALYTPISTGAAVHVSASMAMEGALNELRERLTLQDILLGERTLHLVQPSALLAALVGVLDELGWDIQLRQCQAGASHFALALVVARETDAFAAGTTVAGAKVHASPDDAVAGAVHEALQFVELLYLDRESTQVPDNLRYYLSADGGNLLTERIAAATVAASPHCAGADPLADRLVLHRTKHYAGLAFVEIIAPDAALLSHWESARGRHPYPV